MKAAESAAKTMAANALKLRIDWSKYPKLADIFQNRPTVNVYWHELAGLVRELAEQSLPEPQPAGPVIVLSGGHRFVGATAGDCEHAACSVCGARYGQRFVEGCRR